MAEAGRGYSIVRSCSWQHLSTVGPVWTAMCCSIFCRARGGLILSQPVDLLAQRLGFRPFFLGSFQLGYYSNLM
jgi:hypothetical protein